jgi:hypothetical protein
MADAVKEEAQKATDIKIVEVLVGKEARDETKAKFFDKLQSWAAGKLRGRNQCNRSWKQAFNANYGYSGYAWWPNGHGKSRGSY